MSKVKLFSNYVKKENATVLDGETQVEEIISIVKEALENGVQEICFNYIEEGPEESSPSEDEIRASQLVSDSPNITGNEWLKSQMNVE
jgi:hypothetical protein